MTAAERARACRDRKRAGVMEVAKVPITAKEHALLRDTGLLRSDGYVAAIIRGLRALAHHHAADLLCNDVTKKPTFASRRDALVGSDHDDMP